MEYTYPIEGWKQIFENFTQVKQVRADFDTELLHITIKGHKETLQTTQNELDDTLYKYNCNPKEVANYFLRKHGIITFYHDTLVGFFDIVGYSSFVDKNQNHFDKCISKISNFIVSASNTANTDFGAVKLDHWIFSDSIILVIDTIRYPVFSGSLQVFLATCSDIMRYSMIDGFPLRGAIGGGDFYKDGEVMVSTALIDAARYEKKQEWLGAVLTPKALQVIERAKKLEIKNEGKTTIDFASDKFNYCVRYGEIPWKKEKAEKISNKGVLAKETYYIKPFDMSEKDWAKRYLPNYFNKKKAKEKIKNSHILYAVK